MQIFLPRYWILSLALSHSLLLSVHRKYFSDNPLLVSKPIESQTKTKVFSTISNDFIVGHRQQQERKKKSNIDSCFLFRLFEQSYVSSVYRDKSQRRRFFWWGPDWSSSYKISMKNIIKRPFGEKHADLMIKSRTGGLTNRSKSSHFASSLHPLTWRIKNQQHLRWCQTPREDRQPISLKAVNCKSFFKPSRGRIWWVTKW